MVLSLSAKGLTHGASSAHLAEVYGAEISKTTISTITDAVMEGMSDWQNRATQQPGPIGTTSDEDIDEQFAVNFRSHWTAMTAEAALMRRNGGGAIVNTSSIGSRRANPALPAYGAAMKRALNSITETAAVTWGPEDIRVNGLIPGGTATEMIDAWEAVSPGIIEHINAATPLGRMAEPREVAAWLLSDRAGRRRRRPGISA